MWTNPIVVFGGQWRLLALVLAVLLDHGVIAHTQFTGIHLAVVKVVIVGVHGTRVRSFGIVVGVDQPCGVWVVAHIPVCCRYNTVWV